MEEIWKECIEDSDYEVSNLGKVRNKNNLYQREHLGKILTVKKKPY